MRLDTEPSCRRPQAVTGTVKYWNLYWSGVHHVIPHPGKVYTAYVHCLGNWRISAMRIIFIPVNYQNTNKNSSISSYPDTTTNIDTLNDLRYQACSGQVSKH